MSDDRVIDAEVLEVEHETALVITSPRPAELSRELAEKSRKADEYAVDADAEATRKAYTSDFRHFVTWCDGHGLGYLPADPETIVLYLTDLAEEFKTSTMQRRLSSISVAHRRAGLTPPTASPRVARVWKGIRNRKGTKQDAKKAADAPMIRRFLSGLPDNSVRGLRDRAVILTGFYGAFRRSELVSLTVEDVVTVEEGLTIHLRRSKTDQEGEGRTIGIPYGPDPSTCPVRALLRWIDVAGITSGPIFRSIHKSGSVQSLPLSGRDVARIVKSAAAAAGLDPVEFAGHSLRSGFATSAARAGASDRAIMKQTGHKTRVMVDRYVQAATVFEDNAAGMVTL